MFLSFFKLDPFIEYQWSTYFSILHIHYSSPLYLSFPQKLEESRDLLWFTFLQGQEGTPPAPAAWAGGAVGERRLVVPGFAPTEGQS